MMGKHRPTILEMLSISLMTIIVNHYHLRLNAGMPTWQ